MISKSRQILDSATFIFDTYKQGNFEFFGYDISCLGSDGEIIQEFMPAKDHHLNELLTSFQELTKYNFKKKIKIKLRNNSINIQFSGIKKNKGIKVRAYITGFLFYSSASFGSYTSEENIERIINNLKKCLVISTD